MNKTLITSYRSPTGSALGQGAEAAAEPRPEANPATEKQGGYVIQHHILMMQTNILCI